MHWMQLCSKIPSSRPNGGSCLSRSNVSATCQHQRGNHKALLHLLAASSLSLTFLGFTKHTRGADMLLWGVGAGRQMGCCRAALNLVRRVIGGQNGVNFFEKFTKFTRFALCKPFGNFSINVVNLLTKMQTFLGQNANLFCQNANLFCQNANLFG